MENYHYLQKHQRRKRKRTQYKNSMLMRLGLQKLTCLQWFQLFLKLWELQIGTLLCHNQPLFLSQTSTPKINLNLNLNLNLLQIKVCYLSYLLSIHHFSASLNSDEWKWCICRMNLFSVKKPK